MFRPLLLVLLALIFAALALVAVQPAEAHVPKPAACTKAWEAAPPGKKFAAKQRCIAAQWRHRCVTHPRVVPGHVRVKGLYLRPGKRKGHSPHWRNQRKVIAWLVNEGVRRKLPRKVIITAVATGTQESSLRELDYGDGTSLGPMQLINIHGTPKQRKSIEFSGNWFYNGVIRSYRRNPRQSIVDLAHSVQRSRYPWTVGKWIPEAERTVKIVLGPHCQVA